MRAMYETNGTQASIILKEQWVSVYTCLIQPLWYFLQGLDSWFMHVSEEKLLTDE